MYKINTTHQFEKDLNRCIKRGYPMDDFREVIKIENIIVEPFKSMMSVHKRVGSVVHLFRKHLPVAILFCIGI